MTLSVDIITSKNVRKLLLEKYILILGDSVARGLYKDMIKYSCSDDVLREDELRNRDENPFYGDRLIRGGNQKDLTNGLDYEEVREYSPGGHFRIRFYSLTRSYSTYLKDLENQAIKPDIIIMNSSLWDLSQYGIGSMKSYEENVDGIINSFSQMFPNAIFLWLSALPVSNSSKGGAVVSNLEYLRPVLRGLIRDANSHCSQVCHRHNVLYIDLHTKFSSMLHLLRSDGIHWSAAGIRRMNEIIFNHLQAYYHGVQGFKCSKLRKELEEKMEKFKQRIKESENASFSRHLSNEDSGIIDMDLSPDENPSVSSKRKRNDDKENNSKVMIKSSPKTNEQRIILRKKLSDCTNGKKIEDPFDHRYCDMFHDNEYEGIQLSYFAGYDSESPEKIEPRAVKDLPSKPLPVSNNQEKFSESDYIVLSSSDDDDEEAETNLPSSSNIVLPIYLLIRS